MFGYRVRNQVKNERWDPSSMIVSQKGSSTLVTGDEYILDVAEELLNESRYRRQEDDATIGH